MQKPSRKHENTKQTALQPTGLPPFVIANSRQHLTSNGSRRSRKATAPPLASPFVFSYFVFS